MCAVTVEEPLYYQVSLIEMVTELFEFFLFCNKECFCKENIMVGMQGQN